MLFGIFKNEELQLVPGPATAIVGFYNLCYPNVSIFLLLRLQLLLLVLLLLLLLLPALVEGRVFLIVRTTTLSCALRGGDSFVFLRPCSACLSSGITIMLPKIVFRHHLKIQLLHYLWL